MSYLATLKKDGDGYEAPSGEFFPEAINALGSLLGFCGCGRPQDALRLVRDALRVLADKGPSGAYGEAWSKWYNESYRPALDALFHKDSGFEYLTWYLLSDKNLLEHGGSVPGWLTSLGENVLADLNAMALDDSE